jgi:7-cyano-7-deazaguanine reductase
VPTDAPKPWRSHRTKHKAPEVTFLGAQDQPDFGTLYVTSYPSETVIELKSLKESCTSAVIPPCHTSDFLDVVYDHLMQVYEPLRQRLVFETRPRGGISSKLTIDSDWADPGREGAIPRLGWPGRHLVVSAGSPCGASSRCAQFAMRR